MLATSIVNIHAMNTPLDRTKTLSDNVLIKHHAMSNTPAYKQYEKAKFAHQENNTPDTLYILNLCESELANTKECQAFLYARAQEINKSSNGQNTRKTPYNLPPLSPKQELAEFELAKNFIKNADFAGCAVEKTPEYLLFKDAQKAHDKHKIADTQSLLNMCQSNAKETKKYKEYLKITEQAAQLLKQIEGRGNERIPEKITIDLPAYNTSQPEIESYTCFNFLNKEKILKELKLTHITITEK